MTDTITRSRAFGRTRALGYLPDEDRHLGVGQPASLSFGFIGCGIMGQEHIRNTLVEGRARIGGLYDPAPRSIEQALAACNRGPTPTVYASLAEACADPATDALVISTPNHTHLEVMREAVRHDKAIFVEKPVATTIDAAFELCALAAAHRNVVRVGLQYRYKAVYAQAIDEVRTRGSVGRVHNVSMLEHRFPFLDKVGQWNKFNEYSGGTLVEKCCHYFDLLGLFAGARPQQVFAHGSQAVNFLDFTYRNRRADALDQAQVSIRYANGVIGALSLCMFVPGTREELVVCGDRGRLHTVESAQLGEANTNRMELWLGENGVSRTSEPGYPAYIAGAGHHGATYFEHVAFVDDITAGTRGGPSLADAFWAVVTGAAAQQSIDAGGAIDVENLLPDGLADAPFADQ